MNALMPTTWDRESRTISVDAREADDLVALLQALSVSCANPVDSDEPHRQSVAIQGQPDAKELDRIALLVEEFNKMRKSRSSFGG